MLYHATNQAVLHNIPENAQRILDLGCGSGALGAAIKSRISDCKIIGVTYSEQEAYLANQVLDQVIICDLNSFDGSNLGLFDCITCSHILEHLYDPQKTLCQLKKNLKPGGILIIALPNIMHWKQRLEFIKGNFRYTHGGLMDITHYRFFDWQTSRELVEESGFSVLVHYADGYFPMPGLRKFIQPIAAILDSFAVKVEPSLFGLQFITIAQSKEKELI